MKKKELCLQDGVDVMSRINAWVEAYDFLSVVRLGDCQGVEIPMVLLGEGKRRVLCVGGRADGRCEASPFLLRLVRDYAVLLRGHATLCGYDMTYLFRTYTFGIIPWVPTQMSEPKRSVLGELYNILRYDRCVEGLVALYSTRQEQGAPAVRVNSIRIDRDAWKENGDFGMAWHREQQPEVWEDFSHYLIFRDFLLSFAARLARSR